MVMLRNLESCSGNDALMSESEMRRTARTLPTLLAGSDFICSGFGSIQRYDNMFGPSNLNAEDIDDFLAIQRDWGVDGGLRTADTEQLEHLRRRAAQVARDVYAWFGLADFTDEQVELAVDAAGSKDLGTTDTLAVLNAAHTIKTSGMTGARRRLGAPAVRLPRRGRSGSSTCWPRGSAATTCRPRRSSTSR